MSLTAPSAVVRWLGRPVGAKLGLGGPALGHE
jgi:hypothetical protein